MSRDSPASERNKAPILEILREVFANTRAVLEIGSGTGQHAVHFARHLTHLIWQPSELAEQLAGLRERVANAALANLKPPIELDVRRRPWPTGRHDGIFSANTLHIMDFPSVQDFFDGVGEVLSPGGVLCVYGPFRYHGEFTTPSNAQFDASLKARDPRSGIRDFEAVDALAAAQGLSLLADHAMPANNQTLVWHCKH